MAPLEYRLTPGDALAAARLHHRGHVGSRFCLAVIGFFASLAGGGIYALMQPSVGALGWVALVIIEVIVGLYAVLLVRHAVYPGIVVRRMFREQRNVRHTYMLSWSDRSYVLRGPTGHLDIPWSDYGRWREDKRVLLLYHSSKLYQIVPKRLLTPGAEEVIRRHLLHAGVPRWRLFLG